MRPRSGLAIKHGITCLNTPGTIDHDYRGEVKVILANLGTEPFEVRRGERIAQLVPAPVLKAAFVEVETRWRIRSVAPGVSEVRVYRSSVRPERSRGTCLDFARHKRFLT